MKSRFLRPEWRVQKASSWASIGLLVFITAFIWAPSHDGLIGIYTLAFFLPMLLVIPWQNPKLQHYGGWPTVLAALFAGYSLMSVLWGPSPQDFGYFFGVFLLLMIWLIGVAWINQQVSLKVESIYRLIIISGAIIAPSVVIIFYSQHDLSQRLSSWTVARNPIVTAQVFSVASLLALVESWRTSNNKKSWGFFIAALITLIPGLLSQSRGPIFVLAPTLLLALLLVRPKLSIWLPQMALLLLTLGIYCSLDSITINIFERGLDLSYRAEIWRYIVQQISENFWFGIGLAKDTEIVVPINGHNSIAFHHAHNAHLDTLFRTGIFGLLLVLAHLFLVLRHWRINPQLLPLYLWLIYGILCISSNTRIIFWQLDAKWFFYWIPAGLIAALQIYPQQLDKTK